MSAESTDRISKRKRSELRRSAARKRQLRRRLIRLAIVGAILLPPALWAFDFYGPEEMVEAHVMTTRRWQHVTPQGSHTHTRATLLIEGRNEVEIAQGDTYQRGQRVPVWIQRGRISGWPYFRDVAKPEEVEGQNE